MTAQSGRFDGDSWDPASSVGATATMVAASRALASQGPDPLLNDPFADPLVRAVGLAPFIRLLDGEVGPDDDPASVRRKGHRIHPAGVPFQREQPFAVGDVPDRGRPVVNSRKHTRAVRRKPHVQHPVRQLREGTKQLAGVRVP